MSQTPLDPGKYSYYLLNGKYSTGPVMGLGGYGHVYYAED